MQKDHKHTKDPMVQVRVQWIIEKKKEKKKTARTVGWVVWLSQLAFHGESDLNFSKEESNGTTELLKKKLKKTVARIQPKPVQRQESISKKKGSCCCGLEALLACAVKPYWISSKTVFKEELTCHQDRKCPPPSPPPTDIARSDKKCGGIYMLERFTGTFSSLAHVCSTWPLLWGRVHRKEMIQNCLIKLVLKRVVSHLHMLIG